MKKAFFVLLAAALSCGVLAAGEAKPSARPVITNAMQLIEEMQKAGIKGSETETGLIPKMFTIAGLRQYRAINGEGFTLEVWDFKSASGFDFAVKIFQAVTLVSDTEAYKARPYIIT
ncbi:MAG TPA: hypothetical protein P5511_08370, partial [Candidatus Goldiibacteriota bacterium]|nr:hypothetical protein [Candidatus Goldiibacteriota bacterium]